MKVEAWETLMYHTAWACTDTTYAPTQLSWKNMGKELKMLKSTLFLMSAAQHLWKSDFRLLKDPHAPRPPQGSSGLRSWWVGSAQVPGTVLPWPSGLSLSLTCVCGARKKASESWLVHSRVTPILILKFDIWHQFWFSELFHEYVIYPNYWGLGVLLNCVTLPSPVPVSGNVFHSLSHSDLQAVKFGKNLCIMQEKAKQVVLRLNLSSPYCYLSPHSCLQGQVMPPTSAHNSAAPSSFLGYPVP